MYAESEDKQVKKSIIKISALIVIFFVALICFSLATNQTNEDLTKEMKEATLPIVSLYTNNIQVNELHGYTKSMDVAYMRDTITPVGDDMVIPARVATYGMKIDSISYRIRSMDGKNLISEAEITDQETKSDEISMKIPIQNLITQDKEYVLILELKKKDKTIYYYTRIEKQSGTDLAACLNFAMDFHNNTFDKTKSQELTKYIEPDRTLDNTSLAHVTINSSLNQISWGNLKVTPLSQPVPSIKEINPSYSVITLQYVLTSTNQDNEMEYYNVTEYFRIRYTSSRIYLLNYDRTMNQVFRGENNSFSDTYIQLGIRDSNISYKADQNGNNVCFVQQGELWSYNQSGNRLSQIFSFLGFEGIDERSNYDQHDIKIISIDEVGNINFAVYGYMNRGKHEGEVGVGVYRYDATANTIEEEAFIPSKQSYQTMKTDVGELIYESNFGTLTIMFQGNVYQIDLQKKTTKILVSNVTTNAYAVSNNNEFFAYVDHGESSSDTIHILDLNAQDKDYTIQGREGEYLRPLGFMDKDFIYGTALSGNIVTDRAGNVTFPMHKISIMDMSKSSHKILKEYQKEGYFVSDIKMDQNTIYLDRMTFNGTVYQPTELDTIMNSQENKATQVVVHQISTEDKELQMQLQLPKQVAEEAPKLLTPKEIVLKDNREFALSTEKTTDFYYVYANTGVTLATDDLSKAITNANENMGVVIGQGQKYFWKRAKSTDVRPMQVMVGEADANGNGVQKCISALLESDGINVSVQDLMTNGDTMIQILTTALSDATVLNLNHCSVDSVLYYVSQGVPVIAMTGNDSAVLIVGYDRNNIYVYNPLNGQTTTQSITDADTQFAQNGSVFLTYMKKN